MDYTRKPRPTAQELQADRALMAICRWKESPPDEPAAPHDPAADVAFSKEHGSGFFRAAKRALNQIV